MIPEIKMPARSTIARLAAALLAPAVVPLPVHAQVSGGGGGTLERRMAAFVDSVPIERAAGFFPRHGDYTWIRTVHTPDGDRVGAWRFSAADTEKAMELCGPLFGSFSFLPHGQPLGGLIERAMMSEGRWRRVRGTRFVPPSAPASSPVFVEWRREGSDWVVSSFGDEAYREPPGPLPAAWAEQRDTTSAPLPREDAYAASEAWYAENAPFTFSGRHYTKYGVPRPLSRNLLTWIGRVGGVRLYVERRTPVGEEAVVYVPTAPGEYQPYQTEMSPHCRR